jgi:S1-C subfamily serine protease
MLFTDSDVPAEPHTWAPPDPPVARRRWPRVAATSVVAINTQITVDQGRRSYTGEAAGTGIILTADSEILTNAHVVADATSITVTLDGETTPREAVLVGRDTVNDVALLKISHLRLPTKFSGVLRATPGGLETLH